MDDPVVEAQNDIAEVTSARQTSLNRIWGRILLVLVLLSAVMALLMLVDKGERARVPVLVFLLGNAGGYVSVHKSLAELKDFELEGLSRSWLGLVVPSFIGGVLALVLYLLFLSGIVAGELFPQFDQDSDDSLLRNQVNAESVEILMWQHGTVGAYAKLLFWSFFAGYNQKYAADIIDSVKTRA